jgi:NitT/TauT family transport system substrate-binding protein
VKHSSSLYALTLAAASFGGLSAASAEDLDKLTVVLGYIADVESYGAIYAKEMGYFEEEGLDVTVIPAGVGIDQVQMVASGMATIGIVGPELILAGIDKGEDFKIIAGQFQRTPVAMTCRQDSGVEKPADLVGKRLGVKQIAAAYGDLFLGKNGISKEDVDITSIGPNDISLIVADKIDCMITTFAFSEPRLIEDLGVPTTVISIGDYGMNSQMNSYFVDADYYEAEGSKDILARYMRAEMKAWESYFADPKAAAEYIVNGGFSDGLDVDQQIYHSEQQVDYMISDLTKENGLMWLDPAIWVETAENAKEAGLTSTVLDTAPIITNEILEMADAPKY